MKKKDNIYPFHKMSAPLVTNCCNSLNWSEVTPEGADSPNTKGRTWCHVCNSIKVDNVHRVKNAEELSKVIGKDVSQEYFDNTYDTEKKIKN